MTKVDFDVAMLLKALPAHLPISDAFEKADPQKRNRWRRSQREHMSGWFAQQTSLGSGAFSRTKPNRSARTTYQRLIHPKGIVWIAGSSDLSVG